MIAPGGGLYVSPGVAEASPHLHHHPPPSSSPASRESYSLTDAADIIKNIDMAFAEASTSTITAAREVEEARRNARAASEVARRFLSSPRQLPASKGLLSEFQSMTIATDMIHTNGKSPGAYSYRASPSSLNGGYSSYVSFLSESAKKRKSGSPSLQAHRNADDLVSLSLELDRAKQSLESEKMSHDETKSALAQAKAKNSQLEEQIERLLSEMETQRETSGRKIDSVEQENSHFRMRVEAAEEDAQVALDIAKENNESREQVEGVLHQALQEIHELREQLSTKNALLAQQLKPAQRPPPPPPPPPPPLPPAPPLAPGAARFAGKTDSRRSPTKVVRFADQLSDQGDAPPQTLASRSLVATGRELLNRSLGSPSSRNTPCIADRSFETMAERRQRLKDRLKSLSVDWALPSSPSTSLAASSPSPRNGSHEKLAADSERAGRNVANMLRASGKRLSLPGRWWSEEVANSDIGADSSVNLETLTRHYCTSVEVMVDRKQKEVIELESLCALWERGNTADGNV